MPLMVLRPAMLSLTQIAHINLKWGNRTVFPMIKRDTNYAANSSDRSHEAKIFRCWILLSTFHSLFIKYKNTTQIYNVTLCRSQFFRRR